jgi:hypothetical protein
MQSYFSYSSRNNQTDSIHLLGFGVGYNNLTNPNLLPDSTSPLLNGASFLNPRLTDTFFSVVNHRGAFGTIDWTAGWSNFRPDTLNSSLQSISNPNVGIYPNPFCDLINVESDKLIKNISLYDMSGRKMVVEIFVDGKKAMITTHQIPMGMYILSVDTNTKRIFKN